MFQLFHATDFAIYQSSFFFSSDRKRIRKDVTQHLVATKRNYRRAERELLPFIPNSSASAPALISQSRRSACPSSVTGTALRPTDSERPCRANVDLVLAGRCARQIGTPKWSVYAAKWTSARGAGALVTRAIRPLPSR